MSPGGISYLDMNAGERAARERQIRAMQRWQELALWVFLTALTLGGILLTLSYPDNTPLPMILSDHYSEVLFAFVVGLFPIVFKLVFGILPIEAMRLRQESRKADKEKRKLEEKENPDRSKSSTKSPNAEDLLAYNRDILNIEYGAFARSPAISAVDNLRRQSEESRSIAQRLFTRAGIYLLIGVMIAATGLAFFYMQSGAIGTPKDAMEAAIVLAPRFGILFFIEFFAFFFMRQYRAAMDEYRYYESIARSREEMVFSYLVFEELKDTDALVATVRDGAFSSKVVQLAAGQSTEMLEARKLEGSDLAGLAKIIEGIAALKK